MASLLIQNARIACEENDDLTPADVLVENGTITQIGDQLQAPEGAKVIDASNKILMPAMFDTHIHMREPGQEAKETIKSGSEAAINGGVTGVVLMPNTSPAIDSAAMVRTIYDIAKRDARIPVYTSGCITKGREGKELAGIDGMLKLGVKMLTDDGDAVPDLLLLKHAMEYASEFDCFFASHCEVLELSGPRALNEGVVSHRLGIQGTPACSEEICMDRDIRLAHATGARLHIQHVSSKIGMETIRWWKQMGAKVTAEVSPHHLLFNEEDIGDYDTHYKMNPPLRTAEDNKALLEGLKEGVFDIIATDHAPHTPFEKSQDFVNAPNGITGLETSLISLFHYFVKTNEFGWGLIVNRYSAQPRRMMGLDPVPITEGGKADFLLFDPEGQTTFSSDYMQSLSKNTPFLDKTLDGSIDLVVLGDEVLLER
ncbi:dihydroorotase [Verrucomicrobiaceae bacterium 5K15]|uniref:Dihydroorotase n=1 Tax=Oceaniferula flava TaxID=2800421 RepID=A0AAE2SCL3_9BACT|nr:dihydroorotase [Oceaniferula flavus]MBK1855736.1 dihydroorotase [Oceaniferula flavus]MBM1137043.1 dihydroorotase [Oceaniferula flavus]